MSTTVTELYYYRVATYATRYASKLADAAYEKSSVLFFGDRAITAVPEEEFLGIVVDVTNEKLAADRKAAQRRLNASHPPMFHSCYPIMHNELGDPIPQKLIDEVGVRCVALLAEKEKNDD